MWQAKPSGGYAIDSNEAKLNMFEFKDNLQADWTIYAIAGALGNIANESAFNPWRWQNDTVNYRAGYGLVQFTPAEDYINGYTNYANLSTSSVTTGARPEDGACQCDVLRNDSMGKYQNRQRFCQWYDVEQFYPFSNYKTINNLYDATLAFYFNYEGNKVVAEGTPAEQQADFAIRYASASTCYEIITGEPPGPGPVPSRTIVNSLMKKYIKYGIWF